MGCHEDWTLGHVVLATVQYVGSSKSKDGGGYTDPGATISRSVAGLLKVSQGQTDFMEVRVEERESL